MKTPPSIAIIGGGYAGMAAAVELAARNVPVTVFEAAPSLGGRSRRVNINDTGLDNGLHILIGAYRETLRLITQVAPRRTKPDDLLWRLPLDLQVHGHLRLRAPRLPAPLHLAWALLTAEGLDSADKRALSTFMRAMKARRWRLAPDRTVAALLDEYSQPIVLKEHFYKPLCVAALNTPAERASARVFLNVLRDSLGGSRDASDLLLSRVDLTTLFPKPAADYVRARGGTVELGATVDSVTHGHHQFTLHVQGGARNFDQVICAVSPHRAAPLLAGIGALAPVRQQIEALQYEPIHSVWLQFDGAVKLPSPMIGLANSTAQWLFDRGAICGQTGLIGAVISASEDQVGEVQEALAQRIVGDIARHFGPLPPLRWHRVIAEKRATFSCTPDLDRPAALTPCPGFVLAGDYVASDYPATIEGAVRSGVQAAQRLRKSA